MRSEVRGIDRGSAVANDKDTMPVYNEAGQRNYPAAETSSSEPVRDDGSRTGSTARAAEPYRPRPSVGERVRSFFSGRESAGY